MFRLHKRQGISWLSEWLLASQEGLCSMELDCQNKVWYNMRDVKVYAVEEMLIECGPDSLCKHRISKSALEEEGH